MTAKELMYDFTTVKDVQMQATAKPGSRDIDVDMKATAANGVKAEVTATLHRHEAAKLFGNLAVALGIAPEVRLLLLGEAHRQAATDGHRLYTGLLHSGIANDLK